MLRPRHLLFACLAPIYVAALLMANFVIRRSHGDFTLQSVSQWPQHQYLRRSAAVIGAFVFGLRIFQICPAAGHDVRQRARSVKMRFQQGGAEVLQVNTAGFGVSVPAWAPSFPSSRRHCAILREASVPIDSSYAREKIALGAAGSRRGTNARVSCRCRPRIDHGRASRLEEASYPMAGVFWA
jgi:hypothetical protein